MTFHHVLKDFYARKQFVALLQVFSSRAGSEFFLIDPDKTRMEQPFTASRTVFINLPPIRGETSLRLCSSIQIAERDKQDNLPSFDY